MWKYVKTCQRNHFDDDGDDNDDGSDDYDDTTKTTNNKTISSQICFISLKSNSGWDLASRRLGDVCCRQVNGKVVQGWPLSMLNQRNAERNLIHRARRSG